MPEDDQQRKLAFLMFTDIVGYSRMMGEDEAGTLAFLKIHNSLVRAEIQKQEGRVIKTIGDAFFAEFTSGVKTLTCAIEIHRKLQEYNQGKEIPKQIRAGIHFGEVSVSADDLFGDTVNVAARLESNAPPGGICISKAFYNHIQGKMEVQVVPLGLRQLKNIAQPVEIFHILPLISPSVPSLAFWRKASFQKLMRKGKLPALLLSIAALGWAGYRAFIHWKNESQWTPYLVQDFNLGTKDILASTWHFKTSPLLSQEGIILPGDALLWSQKTLNRQPFRVKITFKVTNNNQAFFRFITPFYLNEEKTNLSLSGYPIPEWSGPEALQEIFLSEKFQTITLDQYASNGQKSSVSQGNFMLSSSNSSLTTSFIFTDDFLRLSSKDDASLETLLRGGDKNDTPELRFGFSGRNILLEKMEIDVKKGDPKLDFILAADHYRLSGEFGKALKIFNDLIESGKDAKEKCRFLFKKSVCQLGSGDEAGAIRTLRQIISDFPDNLYTGYARSDLGFVFYQKGMKSVSKSEKADHGRQSEQYLHELIHKQPDHPEVLKANWIGTLNTADNLQDLPEAKRMAEDIVAGKENFFALDSYDFLMNRVYHVGKATSSKNIQEAQIFTNRLLQNPALAKHLREDIAIRLLKMERALKLNDDFFKLILQSLLDSEFNIFKKEEIYRMICDFEQANGFDKNLRVFEKEMEQNPKGLNLLKLYTNICGKGTLQKNAQNFIKKHITFRKPSKTLDIPTKRLFIKPEKTDLNVFGSSLQLPPQTDGDNIMFLDYDTGGSWGCGLQFLPNVAPLLAFHTVDLLGYSALEFEAKMPPGLIFEVHLNESGDGPIYGESYEGLNKADGEQYIFLGFKGAGKWKKYRVEMSDLKTDTSWGNDRGNNILDLQAIDRIAIAIWGKQGKGRLEVKNVYFVK